MSGSFVRLPGTGRFIARLQADGADAALQDAVSQRALMVLSGTYLCLAGALLTVVWLALPYSPSAAERERVGPDGGRSGRDGRRDAGRRRPPARWSFHGFAVGGTLLVTGTIHFSGAETSPYAFLYLWVALYALYFFTPTKAALHILFIAIAYAGGAGRRPGRPRTSRAGC